VDKLKIDATLIAETIIAGTALIKVLNGPFILANLKEASKALNLRYYNVEYKNRFEVFIAHARDNVS